MEDLSYFSPSLRTQKTADGKSVVTVDGVHFRCSENLKKELRTAKPEKEKSPIVVRVGSSTHVSFILAENIIRE